MTDAFLRFQARAQARALMAARDTAGDARLDRRGLAGAAAVAFLGTPSVAAAQNQGIQPKDCTNANSAADGLIRFINSAASFLMVLGASVAFFMFVLGGFMVLGGGPNRRWVSQGREFVKNSVIGLVIMLSAGVVKFAVTTFFGGILNQVPCEQQIKGKDPIG